MLIRWNNIKFLFSSFRKTFCFAPLKFYLRAPVYANILFFLCGRRLMIVSDSFDAKQNKNGGVYYKRVIRNKRRFIWFTIIRVNLTIYLFMWDKIQTRRRHATRSILSCHQIIIHVRFRLIGSSPRKSLRQYYFSAFSWSFEIQTNIICREKINTQSTGIKEIRTF